MKKAVVWILSLGMVLGMTACSSEPAVQADEDQEVSAQTETIEETDPVKLATTLDAKVSTGIKMSNRLLDSMINHGAEYVEGNMSAKDYADSVVKSEKIAEDLVDDIEEYLSDQDCGDYAETAIMAMKNVWSIHYSMLGYMDGSDEDGLEHASVGIKCQPGYISDVEIARHDYLASVGITEEEIAEIVTSKPLMDNAE